MRTSLFAIGLVLLLPSPPDIRAQQENILDVGTRSQLLLDPDLVYESDGIAFTPHPARKHPANPLLKADQPWEGTYVSAFAGTVLYDKHEQLFKMWYTGPGDAAYFNGGHYATFYATSKDGLQWDKPLVGSRKAKNGQPHNCLGAFACPSVFHEPADKDAARRYKMICFDEDRGYLALTSPDGLRWAEQSPKPIVPISYVDDVISAFFDRRTGQYVALPKMMTPVFGRQRRSIYLSSSQDFRHWSKPEPAYFADRRDDLGSLARLERVRPLLNYPDNLNVMRTEFYGAGAYVAESCVVGFPWVFTINANIPKRGNQEGPIEVQLAVSRNLESWSRPFRTPVLPLGKLGDWDSGMILSASQAIDVGDEVWLYYAGANYTHGAPQLYDAPAEKRGPKSAESIGLATWQRDRFVSADGPAAGGTLTTVPLRFAGTRLEVNALTKAKGEVRVELLDAAGRPLGGFPPSEPIGGDSLRHIVVFPGKPDLASLADKSVCLRFHLRDAELYAFAFRSRPITP